MQDWQDLLSHAILVADLVAWIDLDEKLAKLEAFLRASGISSTVLLERHGKVSGKIW